MGVKEAWLPVVGPDGQTRGQLHIQVLPRTKREDALEDEQANPARDRSLEPVQLMEQEEYLFEFFLNDISPDATVTTDHPEVFEANRTNGRDGRIRPRLHVGALRVQVLVNGALFGQFGLEVRSAKLDYLSHYRWMLDDIAEEFTEIVMERFAASEQRFQVAEGQAKTLYQRFAFLSSLLSSAQFDAAISQVLGRPHRAWVEEEEYRSPGRGLAVSSAAARQIARAGPRVEWKAGVVPHLPTQVVVQRSVETLDTPENRFIKYVLTQWRDLAAQVERALEKERETNPVARGRRETASVIERLDELLSAEMFSDVGDMSYFPANSQVLQKRAGYREVFRAFVQSEAAAAFQWEGGDEIYRAGQKNVAALYEFWTYLQLATVVEGLCDVFRRESLVEVGPNGMGIALKRGWQHPLSGVVTRHNRRIQLDLFFNKTFRKGRSGTWSLPMRPDCSLRVRPAPGEPARFDEVWLHFDAKYRIDNLVQLYGGVPDDPSEEDQYLNEIEEEERQLGTAKQADLVKMHAYKDAILRSEGAYVLYPGTDDAPPFSTYPHEILPGLGAFPLRPTGTGEAKGADGVRTFLNQVIDHLASQYTQRERSRYFQTKAYSDDSRYQGVAPATPFLSAPPADTRVLLGYVKSPEHRRWVVQNRLYNLRSDGRRGTVGLGSEELAAQLLVLYSDHPEHGFAEVWAVSGGPALVTRTGMVDLAYPDPRGDQYYCLLLSEVDCSTWPMQITPRWVENVRNQLRPHAEHGAPVAVTWLDMVRFRPTGPV